VKQLIFILSLAIFLPATAFGDDVVAARQHFQKGSTLYDLGQFHDAAKEYEEAYKAHSDPALLFNIGQAYRFANEPAEAVRAYRSYLRRVPNAPHRVEIEGHITRLQAAMSAPTTPPTTTTPPATTPSGAPPPATTPTTTPTTSAPEATVNAQPATETPPLYKRWWLWTIVGGVVVVGVGVGLAVAYTTPKDASAPSSNVFTVSF
jgi:tetratricopeptide (TPR) repeat protein